VSGAVAADTGYVITMVLDGAGGTLSGYLNGESIGSVGGVGTLYRHGADMGLGGMIQDAVFHDGSQGIGDGLAFEGLIGETVIYDRALDGADRQQLDDYLTEKWGTAPVASVASLEEDDLGADAEGDFLL